MAVPRSLPAEQNAISVFQKQTGKLPSAPQEWAQVHRIAYPTELPNELKSTTAASFYQSVGSGAQPVSPAAPTVTTPQARPVDTSGRIPLQQLQQDVQTTRQQASNMIGQANPAMQVLQDALKAKTQSAQANIGESDLFKKAGLTGMPVLNQSLAQTGQELNDAKTYFQNTITKMAGLYKSQADQAKFNYDAAVDAYNVESERLQKLAETAAAHKRELEIIARKHELDMELENFRRSTPTFSESMDLYEQGLETAPGGGFQTRVDTSGASAVDIANAIKKVESGGNYNAKGGSGEFGAYQFMPATWDGWAKQYAAENNIKASIAPTPANQDKVAQWKIGKLLDQGYNAQQIASIWNSGQPTWEGKTGINKYGVKYDVPGYVNKVSGALKQVMSSPQRTAQGGAPSPDTYMRQLDSVASGASVSTKKDYKQALQKLISSNDTEGINEYLDSLAYQNLKGKRKERFESANDTIGEVGNAFNKFDAFKATNPGIWRSVLESTKPLANVSSKKEWQTFKGQLAEAQAGYKNSIFGAALTPEESKQANAFLIDFERDTAGTIETKMNSMRDLAGRVQQRILNEQRGIFEKAPQPSSSKQTTAKKSLADLLKEAGL